MSIFDSMHRKWAVICMHIDFLPYIDLEICAYKDQSVQWFRMLCKKTRNILFSGPFFLYILWVKLWSGFSISFDFYIIFFGIIITDFLPDELALPNNFANFSLTSITRKRNLYYRHYFALISFDAQNQKKFFIYFVAKKKCIKQLYHDLWPFFNIFRWFLLRIKKIFKINFAHQIIGLCSLVIIKNICLTRRKFSNINTILFQV